MKCKCLCMLLPLVLALAGCGGGSGGAPAAGTPPDPTGPTDFVAFVTSLFEQTDDVSDPVPIGDLAFTGLENEDPTLFDDVLSTFGGP